MTLQEKRIFQSIDKLTFILYCILLFIGLMAIYIVDFNNQDKLFSYFFRFNTSFSKQFLFMVVGLIISYFILLIESRFIFSLSYICYFLGIGLMILTIFIGENINGSKSWISLFGSFNLQPTEICKIFTSLALARYFSNKDSSSSRFRGEYITAIFLVLFPAVLTILQHELGQAIIYFSLIFALYREGLPTYILVSTIYLTILVISSLVFDPLKLIIGLVVILLIFLMFNLKRIKKNKSILFVLAFLLIFSAGVQRYVVPYIFNNLLECYQSTRIYSLIGKEYDCTENVKSKSISNKSQGYKKPDNYNVKQSMITIGSGGLLGKGVFKSTQTKGKYVPEQDTDFIFTSIGEAFGFIGCSIFLIIYLIFILRLLYIAENQRNSFARVYGYCVLGFFFMHFLINVNMTIGLFPIVGITLPFISYGGSSLLTFNVLLFILLKLDIDKQKVLR